MNGTTATAPPPTKSPLRMAVASQLGGPDSPVLDPTPEERAGGDPPRAVIRERFYLMGYAIARKGGLPGVKKDNPEAARDFLDAKWAEWEAAHPEK